MFAPKKIFQCIKRIKIKKKKQNANIDIVNINDKYTFYNNRNEKI